MEFGTGHLDKEVDDVWAFNLNQSPNQKGCQATYKVDGHSVRANPGVGMVERLLDEALQGSLAKQLVYQILQIGLGRMIE